MTAIAETRECVCQVLPTSILTSANIIEPLTAPRKNVEMNGVRVGIKDRCLSRQTSIVNMKKSVRIAQNIIQNVILARMGRHSAKMGIKAHRQPKHVRNQRISKPNLNEPISTLWASGAPINSNAAHEVIVTAQVLGFSGPEPYPSSTVMLNACAQEMPSPKRMALEYGESSNRTGFQM